MTTQTLETQNLLAKHEMNHMPSLVVTNIKRLILQDSLVSHVPHDAPHHGCGGCDYR